MISAHWYTNGLLIQRTDKPKKINDMYGFPQELYDLSYPVSGDISLSDAVLELFDKPPTIDNSWGIDHGAWSVLVHMYPEADIPVVQLSVDRTRSAEALYQVGHQLITLREKGVLIIGSGNIVHNLRRVDFNMANEGYDWCSSFDDDIEEAILNHDQQQVINYSKLGNKAQLSVPTPDHFLPLVMGLGATDAHDRIEVFNKGFDLGSLSMTGYIFMI